jgi:hypothetical protein
MFIPDPGSEFFPSRIPDPRSAPRNFKYFNPKKWILSSRKLIRVVDPGSRIQGSKRYRIRIRNTGLNWFCFCQELDSPMGEDDMSDSIYNPAKIEVFVQTLLFLGHKSFSHSFAAIAKFHSVFKTLSDTEEAQICVLRSLFELWKTHQQVGRRSTRNNPRCVLQY